MMAWVALAFGLSGFAALSLAMERHRMQIPGCGSGPMRVALWRMAGTLLLALSLAACLAVWSTSVAIAIWLGVLTAAALAIGLMLSYQPRAVPASACFALALGVAGVIRHVHAASSS